MPHKQPWLDNDHKSRKKAELQAQWDKEAKIFNIQNRAIRAVLNGCNGESAGFENCKKCGNYECIKAWREQNKLWNMTDKEAEAACHVQEAEQCTQKKVCESFAACQSCHGQKSLNHPGENANGSSLKSADLFAGNRVNLNRKV
jgi:hypothetical protein